MKTTRSGQFYEFENGKGRILLCVDSKETTLEWNSEENGNFNKVRFSRKFCLDFAEVIRKNYPEASRNGKVFPLRPD